MRGLFVRDLTLSKATGLERRALVIILRRYCCARTAHGETTPSTKRKKKPKEDGKKYTGKKKKSERNIPILLLVCDYANFGLWPSVRLSIILL